MFTINLRIVRFRMSLGYAFCTKLGVKTDRVVHLRPTAEGEEDMGPQEINFSVQMVESEQPSCSHKHLKHGKYLLLERAREENTSAASVFRLHNQQFED